MSQVIKSTFILALVGAVAACEPPERTDDVSPADRGTETAVNDTVRIDFTTFQQEVEREIEEIRQELGQVEARVAQQDPDAWQNLREDTDRELEEIRSDLERARADNGDEWVRDQYDDVAQRLASLHNDMVTRELESIEDVGTFQQVAMERLDRLEQQLEEIQSGHMEHRPGQHEREDVERQEQERERGQMRQEGVFEDDIEDLRERLTELRADVQQLAQEDEGWFRDEQDRIAGDIGDLTEDIKERSYETRWVRGEHGEPGQERQRQYN